MFGLAVEEFSRDRGICEWKNSSFSSYRLLNSSSLLLQFHNNIIKLSL